MAIIQDGGGKNPALQIDPDGRARVEAKTNDRSFFISEEEGQSYVLISTSLVLAVGEYGAYWQNTSTDKNLHIKDVTVNSFQAGEFEISTVTGTAAGGVALTPSNLNRTSANDADATARGNGSITSLTHQTLYYKNHIGKFGHHDEDFEGALILGQNDAIAVKWVSQDSAGSTTTSTIVIFGYYD